MGNSCTRISESCTNVAILTDRRLAAVYRLRHLKAKPLTLLGYMPSLMKSWLNP